MQGQVAAATPPVSSARPASAGAVTASQPPPSLDVESTPPPGVGAGKPVVFVSRPRSAGGYNNTNKRTPITSTRAPKSAPRVLRGASPLHPSLHQQYPQGALDQPKEKKVPVTAAQLRAKHAEDRVALRQFMNQVKQRRREEGETIDLYTI